MSGGNPNKTGVQAMKLALAGFIVPFMFVYSPALLLINTTGLGALLVAATAMVGVVALGAAAEGWFIAEASTMQRAALLAGSLLLINPGGITDILGLALIALVWIWQKVSMAKEVPLEA